MVVGRRRGLEIGSDRVQLRDTHGASASGNRRFEAESIENVASRLCTGHESMFTGSIYTGPDHSSAELCDRTACYRLQGPY